MSEWIRITQTTIKKFKKGFENCVMRDRKLLKWYKADGTIDYNQGGDGFQWQVKKAQRQATRNNGTQVVTFAPVNTFVDATLDYQGLVMAEQQSKRERLKNRGNEALVNIWGTIVKDLFDDLSDRFSEELYIDSAATGNGAAMSGVDTMFSTPTQTVDVTQTTTTAARTANAADPVGYPLATYAGISTVLGAAGGSWSGPWPHVGKGDAVYDYFSGLMVNYTSSFFGSTTWANNCVSAIRFANTYSNRNKASEGTVNNVLMHNDLFRQFKDKKDAVERAIVTDKKEREFGISEDYIMQDGVRLETEFGLPNNTAYGFNRRQMRLRSMQDELFNADGPIEDLASRTHRLVVDFLGQLQFNSPRFFYRLTAIA